VVRSLAELPAGEHYEVVVAMDVIEHISDPVAILRTLREVVAPGASMYAAFPNRKSWRGLLHKGRWRMVRPLGHLHFFSAKSAGLMFEAAGFSITKLRTTDLLDRADVWGVKRRLAYLAQSLGWGDQLVVYAKPDERAA
jgi:SAM-dependent methyltransferase